MANINNLTNKNMNTNKDSFEFKFRQRFPEKQILASKLAAIDNTIVFDRNDKILELISELANDAYNTGVWAALCDSEVKSKLSHEKRMDISNKLHKK